MCSLIRKGITEAPVENSRAKGSREEESTREKALNGMFDLLRNSLAFGSIALMRVNGAEYQGQDIVPVIIGRKAPSEYTASMYSRDGMFDYGDTMMWIHDVESQDVGEFKVPDVLEGDETRAVPLKCLAGPGQGLQGYMERVPLRPGEASPNNLYRLLPGVVEDARSNLVLMATSPCLAFRNFRSVALSQADEARAFVKPTRFEHGTLLRSGFRAPLWGNQREWSGLKKLTAKVVDVTTFEKERRHYYRLEWEGTERDQILANVPRDVDEGYVERYLLR